jgi:hypothetical protein
VKKILKLGHVKLGDVVCSEQWENWLSEQVGGDLVIFWIEEQSHRWKEFGNNESHPSIFWASNERGLGSATWPSFNTGAAYDEIVYGWGTSKEADNTKLICTLDEWQGKHGIEAAVKESKPPSKNTTKRSFR